MFVFVLVYIYCLRHVQIFERMFFIQFDSMICKSILIDTIHTLQFFRRIIYIRSFVRACVRALVDSSEDLFKRCVHPSCTVLYTYGQICSSIQVHQPNGTKSKSLFVIFQSIYTKGRVILLQQTSWTSSTFNIIIVIMCISINQLWKALVKLNLKVTRYLVNNGNWKRENESERERGKGI